jgi:hypothetical protein
MAIIFNYPCHLIEMLSRKVKYEWLPLDAYQSYGNLKKWVLQILGNVGGKSK